MDKKHKKGNKTSDNKKTETKNHILEEMDVPQIKEPEPVCSICGEPIKAIIEAISEPKGGYSHFDCVLKKLTKEYRVEAPSKISYIGHGTFAVVSPDGLGNYTIGERIQYESNETFASMKKFVEGQKS